MKNIKKVEDNVTIKKKNIFNCKNKNGFTLIELLAVIIILGILMIIAIPSVTKYINDSRRSAYVDTAKEIIAGARNIVNEGNLGIYDTNTTYYIPSSYIKTENALKSPYGDFVQAYVVVTYDGKGYDYYWTSVDDAGQGVKEIIAYDKLEADNIESDLIPDMVDPIKTKIGIGNRTEIKVLDENGNWVHQIHLDDISNNVFQGENGTNTNNLNKICIPATTLHTATCEKESTGYGCEISVGYGNKITYGTKVSGTPKAGDAYDCDVNGDGTFDPATERFYYLGDYYDTNTQSYDDTKAVLIYYTNISNNGSTITASQSNYSYSTQEVAKSLGYTCAYTNGCNILGPLVAYEQLPNSSQWSNSKLIMPGERYIFGLNSSSWNENRYELFDYKNKAARFLNFKEIPSVCKNGKPNEKNFLLNCNYLMENNKLYETENEYTGRYWLETINSASNSFVWYVEGNANNLLNYNAKASSAGVRPVIAVFKKDL